jgi:hypothetical protein
MSNVLTTKAATVTNTATAVLLLAANKGASYRSIGLPVAGSLFVGNPGVTTTGAAIGVLVSNTLPFVMQANDVNGFIGIYQGDLWGVATATCTATIVEISS